MEDRDRDWDEGCAFTGVVVLEGGQKRKTHFLIGELKKEKVSRLMIDVDNCMDHSVVAKFMDLMTSYASTNVRISN